MNALELLELMIEEINSKSKERIRKFLLENSDPEKLKTRPVDRIVDLLMHIAEKDGEINPYSKIEHSDSAEILYQNPKSTLWLKINIQVTSDSPPKIKGFSFQPSDPPIEKRQQSLSIEELQVAIPEFLKPMADADDFSGAVLVAKDEEVLYSDAFGYANRVEKIPNALNTKFNLGSINKMFTGISIAKLAQQGKLSFNDTVDELLPNSNIPNADTITMNQLLTHTSGLGNYFTPEFSKNSKKYTQVKDLVKLISTQKTSFEPGTKMGYSNSAFVIAGAIVEQISGISYFDFVKQNIFEVAEMANSDSFRLDSKMPNLAIGYTKMTPEGKAEEWQSNESIIPVKGSPAGGGYSTVLDMFNFSKAFRANKILNESYRKKVTSNQIKITLRDSKDNRKYGYGFSIQEYQDELIYGHFGGAPGVNAGFSIYDSNKFTVIALANQDPSAAEIVMQRIKRMILG